MSSTTGGSSPAGTESRSDWCSSRLSARAPYRHVVGVGDHRIDRRSCRAAGPSPHRCRRRRRGCDRRAPTQATPFSRASAIAVSAARCITRWPMPLSPSTIAVAGAVLPTVMLALRIDAAGLDAPDVLRQAEHAVRIGAGEIGFQHQLGDIARHRRPACRPPASRRRSGPRWRTAATRVGPAFYCHAGQQLLHQTVERRELVASRRTTAP